MIPGSAHRGILAIVFAAAISALVAACATPPSTYRFEPFSGPLAAANQDFHRHYDRERDRIQRSFGTPGTPVMVVIGNYVVLLRNGQRERVRVVPPRYHELKAVSHIAFSVFLLLDGLGPGTVGEAGIGDIRALRQSIVSVRDSMTADTPSSWSWLVGRSIDLLDGILRDGAIDADRYLQYARGARSVIDDHAYLAARLHLESLDAQVKAWLTAMTPDERESLRVVIGASHQARHREATLQYFGRLLGEETGPGASREDRLVYAEGIYDEPGVLRLLAKHLLDQRAAAAFFDDRFRLQQDLLSQGADRALRSIAR